MNLSGLHKYCHNDSSGLPHKQRAACGQREEYTFNTLICNKLCGNNTELAQSLQLYMGTAEPERLTS